MKTMHTIHTMYALKNAEGEYRADAYEDHASWRFDDIDRACLFSKKQHALDLAKRLRTLRNQTWSVVAVETGRKEILEV